MPDTKPILFVTHDVNSVLSLADLFEELKLRNPIIIVKNGEEAIDFLKDASYELPSVIFTDLNFSEVNNLELIQNIRQKSFSEEIPVIITASSEKEIETHQAFQLGAAGYIANMKTSTNFKTKLTTLLKFWTMS